MSAPNGEQPIQDPQRLAELEEQVRRMREAQGLDDAQSIANGAPSGPGGPFEIERPRAPATPAAPPAPASRPETAGEQVDRLQAAQATSETEDFEAFWSEQSGGKKLTNIGSPKRDLQLPAGMPLRFEIEQRRLADREDIESVRYLFDILFGAGCWDDLVARGLDTAQLPILFVWATMNLAGKDTTLAQATAEHVRMSAEKSAGKEPTPPAGMTRGGSSSAGGA